MSEQVFWVVCDGTGAPLGMGSCAAPEYQWQTPPEGCIHVKVDAALALAVHTDRGGWRALGGAMVEREPIAAVLSKAEIAAGGVDAATITGYPAGCTIEVTGGWAEKFGPMVHALSGDADPLVLTMSTPGRLRVRISKDPTHKAWEAAIVAAG